MTGVWFPDAAPFCPLVLPVLPPAAVLPLPAVLPVLADCWPAPPQLAVELPDTPVAEFPHTCTGA